MRVLIVGAGAVGGYFGGRLSAAGRDVTFLVRPGRAVQLERDGLVIESPAGDVRLPTPRLVTAERLSEPFDLILLACRAYDVDAAIDDLAPAVGDESVILPLVNGMAHMASLGRRFGEAAIAGGCCWIPVDLEDGRVLHRGALKRLAFGIPGDPGGRGDAIAELLDVPGVDRELRTDIIDLMWAKWVSIASLAGTNLLARGTVGEMVAAGAGVAAEAFLDECLAIARFNGAHPPVGEIEAWLAALTGPGSPTTASFYRDTLAGRRTEHQAILADLLSRAAPGIVSPLLRFAVAAASIYESRRNG